MFEICVLLIPIDKWCPEEQGFISLPGSGQCFKPIVDQGKGNWSQAKELCAAQTPGMVLAEPSQDHTLALRKTLTESEKYGKNYVIQYIMLYFTMYSTTF